MSTHPSLFPHFLKILAYYTLLQQQILYIRIFKSFLITDKAITILILRN